MERLSPVRVTPEGVRDGDPTILAAMCARRGPSVLAYCREVTAPGHALEAAARAMAGFRAEVAGAEDPGALDPERLLLSLTRHAAAAQAPPPPAEHGSLRMKLAARGRRRPCELVPELLVAQAEHTLSPADTERLERHLQRCPHCAAAAQRFHAGEQAYREPPDESLDELESNRMLEALVAAAPVGPAAPSGETGALAGDGHPPVEPDHPPAGADQDEPAGEAAASPDLDPAPEPKAPPDLDPTAEPEASHHLEPAPDQPEAPPAEAPDNQADGEPPPDPLEPSQAELGADGLPLGPPGAMDARDLRPPYETAAELHETAGEGDEPRHELPKLPALVGLQARRTPWGWRLAVPAVVVAGALAAALVVAGVFNSNSSHSPRPLRPPAGTSNTFAGGAVAGSHRRAHHSRHHASHHPRGLSTLSHRHSSRTHHRSSRTRHHRSSSSRAPTRPHPSTRSPAPTTPAPRRSKGPSARY